MSLVDDIHTSRERESGEEKGKTYSIIFQLIKLFVVQKILFGSLHFLLEFPMKAFACVDIREFLIVFVEMVRFALIN